MDHLFVRETLNFSVVLGGVSSKMFSEVAFTLFAIEINGVPISHRFRRRRLEEQTGFEPLLAISDIQTT
jgi:hypothetical protein